MTSKPRIRVHGNFWVPVEPEVVSYFYQGSFHEIPPHSDNVPFQTHVYDRETFELRGGWNWFRVHLIGEPEDNRKAPGA